MTWNVRLMKMYDEPDEVYFEMREVFYNEMGKPLGHTAAIVGGQNIDEIKHYIGFMNEALTRHILDEKNFGGEG